jgi:hypothetical protein
MKWIEALKVFNQGKGTWCVARKGTPEYDEVKRIMNSSKPEAVAKRNEERGEKVKEQLKEVASASSKRREEAKKKYAEKLAEMEHHKAKAPEPAPLKKATTKSQYLKMSDYLIENYLNEHHEYFKDHPSYKIYTQFYKGHPHIEVYDGKEFAGRLDVVNMSEEERVEKERLFIRKIMINSPDWSKWIKAFVSRKVDKLGEDIAEETDKKEKNKMLKKYQKTEEILGYF